MKNNVVSRRQFAVASVVGLGGAALGCLANKGVRTPTGVAGAPIARIPAAIATSVGAVTNPTQNSANEALITDLRSLVAPFELHNEVVGSTLVSIDIDEHHRGVLTLKDRSGKEFMVDVARRGSSTDSHKPIFSTNQYNLFLRNGAKGRTQTTESQGLAVMALGDVIRFNEKNSVPLPLISKEKQWALENKQRRG